MKFLVTITAIALAFTSAVTAQAACDAIASSIPSCAVTCLASAGTQIGCQSKDYACQCKSTAAIQSAIEPCVLSGCGLASALQIAPIATKLCSCAAATATVSKASAGVMGVRAGAAPTTLVTATVG